MIGPISTTAAVAGLVPAGAFLFPTRRRAGISLATLGWTLLVGIALLGGSL